MNATKKPGRVALGIGVTAVVLAVLTVAAVILVLVFPNGFTGLSNPRDAGAGAFLNGDSSICDVSFYALDPDDTTKSNPDKEVPYAVGTPVTQRDEAGIKAELEERRECGSDNTFDPLLTSTHYADWSAAGLTKIKVAYSKIDAFAAKIADDSKLYAQVITELETLENASAFSIQKVNAGLWSVYVVPDGHGKLVTHVGRSAHSGHAAVFTHPSGAVVMYRLECGFQILHDTPPPGLPECDEVECNPCQQDCGPPCTRLCNPCPYNPNLPENSPLCFAPKSDDPKDYVYPTDKPKVVDDGGGETTSDPVDTTVVGDNGGTTSSTDDVGSQTGTTADGASSNTGSNGQEETNQGGTGNGTDTGGF